MFNKHLFKILFGFSAIVAIGMISLTAIDKYQNQQAAASVSGSR